MKFEWDRKSLMDGLAVYGQRSAQNKVAPTLYTRRPSYQTPADQSAPVGENKVPLSSADSSSSSSESEDVNMTKSQPVESPNDLPQESYRNSQDDGVRISTARVRSEVCVPAGSTVTRSIMMDSSENASANLAVTASVSFDFYEDDQHFLRLMEALASFQQAHGLTPSGGDNFNIRVRTRRDVSSFDNSADVPIGTAKTRSVATQTDRRASESRSTSPMAFENPDAPGDNLPQGFGLCHPIPAIDEAAMEAEYDKLSDIVEGECSDINSQDSQELRQ